LSSFVIVINLTDPIFLEVLPTDGTLFLFEDVYQLCIGDMVQSHPSSGGVDGDGSPGGVQKNFVLCGTDLLSVADFAA